MVIKYACVFSSFFQIPQIFFFTFYACLLRLSRTLILQKCIGSLATPPTYLGRSILALHRCFKDGLKIRMCFFFRILKLFLSLFSHF